MGHENASGISLKIECLKLKIQCNAKNDNRMLIHLSLSTRMCKSIFSFTQSIYLPLLLPSPLFLHLFLCQPDAGKYIAPEWSIEGPSKNSTESIVPEKSWYFSLSLHYSFLYLFAVLKVGKAFIDLSRPLINTSTGDLNTEEENQLNEDLVS